jgi:hypothetical protein
MVGLPLFVTDTGHPVSPGANVDTICPFIVAAVPPTLIPPFAPTLPPLESKVGAVFAGLSFADKKLPVVILPPKESGFEAALQPVPVANSPAGWFEFCGVCAISACTMRRVPVELTASEVSRYTGL